jgi:hypothetical protein
MPTTLDDCADAAGSFNNPNTPGNGIPGTGGTPSPSANPYVPPELCKGEWSLTDASNKNSSSYQENLAAENLNVSGAAVNVFKLLGIHEQGRLVDLTGQGQAISSSGGGELAFDSLAPPWLSIGETALAVVQKPAYLGYDFGPRQTSFGQAEVLPEANNTLHVTSFRITQPLANNRALQVRVERSNGGYKVNPLNVNFTGAGNGGIGDFVSGFAPKPGTFMVVATTGTLFSVTFISSTASTPLGVATVGTRFNSPIGSFLITAGSTPFAAGDMFTMPIELDWYRVDVVNLPNIDTPVTVRVKQSAPSRFWRLVPLSFTGVMTPGAVWVVDKLELFDYQQTRLDDIQDSLYLENRDRDYAKTAIQIKAAYTPFDAVSDLSKFGFQIADVYTFTTSYATMVSALGRPIVVGDVLEIPSELQYDHNLRPVRKFIEVSDVSWSAEGFTTDWRPILYRFQAQNLIPSQEHRDILGTVDTQKYIIDDGSFFAGIEQIQTSPLTVSEKNEQDAITAVPEKGTNVREQASGTNRNSNPATYDGVGPYVEDGLPPDGLPYETGFGKLPDVSGATDGAYFRLEYDPKLKIPARLYKFSSVKGKWIFVETDRRTERSAHRPSQLEILDRTQTMSLTTKRVS